MNSADCLYLESRLIELANSAQSSTLTNGQYPPLPNLTAPAKDTAENFLFQVQTLLPVFNINFFVAPPNLSQLPSATLIAPQADQEQLLSPIASPTFLLATATVHAEAEQVNNKFVVRYGSIASASEAPSLGIYGLALRKQLRQDNKLVDNAEDEKWTFSQDVEFNSPSAAAAVICGYNVSGPAIWKLKGTTQTYSEWLQAQVNAVSSVHNGSETP